MISNEKPGAAHQRRGTEPGGHALQFYAKQKLFFKKILNFISYLVFLGKYSILCYIWFTRASEMIF